MDVIFDTPYKFVYKGGIYITLTFIVNRIVVDLFIGPSNWISLFVGSFTLFTV